MPVLRQEKTIAKETLEHMYVQEKRSMQEIADALGCSVNKIVYWMDKYEITRRDWSEATYQKRNPLGDPFQIREPVSEEERDLMMLAIGLYIGEGTKKADSVRFTNSNPQVICAFLRFLEQICGVEKSKVRAWLNVYDDVNLEAALDFWLEATGLEQEQFSKPFVQKSRGGSYTHKSKYGTLTIIVGNRKLANFVKDCCNKALAKFA